MVKEYDKFMEIKEYPEYARENIEKLSSFPGVQKVKTLKKRKINEIWVKQIKFLGDFNEKELVKESERLFLQSYIKLRGSQHNDLMQWMEEQMKLNKAKRRVGKSFIKSMG